MMVQNISMLRGNYVLYYIAIHLFKLVITYINAYQIYKIPLTGADGYGFNYLAQCAAEEANGNLFQIFISEYGFFPQILGFFYSFLGSNYVYGCFIILIFSLFMFRYVILTVYELTDNYNLAQKCGILCSAWPILFIHSTSILRECPVNLFFVISFYCFVRYVKYRTPLSFAGAFFWSALSTMLHSGMIAVWASYCFFYMMLGRTGKITLSIPKVIIGFLLVFALMGTSFSERMTSKFNELEGIETLDEAMSVISGDSASANTQYISSLPSNPIKLTALMPYLFIMFALSPLPYQIHSVGTAISWLIDAVPQTFLIWCMYQYLYRRRKLGTPHIIAVKTAGLWIIVFTYLIFSLGTSCYGTAIRHRAKITPMLVIFAAMYWDEKKREKYIDYNSRNYIG